MQFKAILAVAAAAAATSAPSALASPLHRRDDVSVAYDHNYDRATDLSLASGTCCDGSNGLLTKGYSSIGVLSAYAAASPYVGGWNCGKCYTVSYNGRSVNVIAVDLGNSFVMGEDAMNDLAGGQAEALGRVAAGRGGPVRVRPVI
ncbi:Cerato-platanin-domain-containing protein [Zopfochytrium polystomum]|nr:Cerato-platanin-domain-containing protein [Zopfochytrium polystomum]